MLTTASHSRSERELHTAWLDERNTGMVRLTTICAQVGRRRRRRREGVRARREARGLSS